MRLLKLLRQQKHFLKTGIIGKDRLATLTSWWWNRWKHSSLPPVHIPSEEPLLTWRMENALIKSSPSPGIVKEAELPRKKKKRTTWYSELMCVYDICGLWEILESERSTVLGNWRWVFWKREESKFAVQRKVSDIGRILE